MSDTRSGGRWKRARAECLAAAGGECQNCGAPATEAHHVVPWSKAPAMRYEQDNLIALCGPCHRAIPKPAPDPDRRPIRPRRDLSDTERAWAELLAERWPEAFSPPDPEPQPDPAPELIGVAEVTPQVGEWPDPVTLELPF